MTLSFKHMKRQQVRDEQYITYHYILRGSRSGTNNILPTITFWESAGQGRTIYYLPLRSAKQSSRILWMAFDKSLPNPPYVWFRISCCSGIVLLCLSRGISKLLTSSNDTSPTRFVVVSIVKYSTNKATCSSIEVQFDVVTDGCRSMATHMSTLQLSGNKIYPLTYERGWMGVRNLEFNKIIGAYLWFGKWNITLINSNKFWLFCLIWYSIACIIRYS